LAWILCYRAGPVFSGFGARIQVMRRFLPIALLALCSLPCTAYDLTGHVEPAGTVAISLHGTLSPLEKSTVSADDGYFGFSKIPAGTYTLVVSTQARGEMVQTVEVSAGTVDSKGRIDLLLKVNGATLESEDGRSSGAIVSATVLSIPDRATKEFEQAQQCLAHSDAACAVPHLQKSVEIAPRYVAAWNQLGTLAYQAHAYTDAEADFRKALEFDPEAFEPLVNLGGVLLNLERPREALGYNQQAASRRPNDALANSQLGMDYFAIGDLDAAEKCLKAALRLDPAHFSYPQLTLAEIFLKRNDRAGALDQYRDFLKRHPDSPQAAGIRAKVRQLSQ
jgi:Tfp pilus assembly protein PilF